MDNLLIGGQGLIVQMDESMIFIGKYNVGRAAEGATANGRRTRTGGAAVVGGAMVAAAARFMVRKAIRDTKGCMRPSTGIIIGSQKH